ncbi:MAG: amylo-alpha-1,6-glucosidase [Lachnospiraceae bacterium]|nr:amylo-alpha-1,6-glucosidase [Lachnospiraceae bacterium]
MKMIYGKQDWKTMERGEENCFLMTNGLGGFSSLTMIGSASRNDHALLMACTQAPNHRWNMLHRLGEQVEMGGRTFRISSQKFADGHREEGYRFLDCFTYEDTPVWKFQVEGVEIRKEMAMKQGANAIGIRYEICNRGKSRCRLILTPFFQFSPKGMEPDEKQKFTAEWISDFAGGWDRNRGRIVSGGLTLFFRTNGKVFEIPEKTENYYYGYDACDGRREQGHATANHEIFCSTAPFTSDVLEIVYEMEESEDTVVDMITGLKTHRNRLSERAGFQSDAAAMLSRSANQFIAKRESTGGDTILAGFPFFEDWGRDTMIALPGLCLSTKQYESAGKILRTFAANERNGLMPNLFPEGGQEPMYNTVDAALLFINCVYLYYVSTKDRAFIMEMYPVMEHIIDNYIKGTDFDIHMDEDGLILAGEGLSQVTWMDVRVGEILPTPRHGKPVEINAYWYNALRIMEMFESFIPAAGEEDSGRKDNIQKDNRRKDKVLKNNDRKGTAPKKTDYGKLAEKVRISFEKEFWMEDRGCLKDVISGTYADTQIRCNQIWAVSMPFTMLDREKERHIVDTVYEKLYTPYGLRTLDMDDPEFHAHYGGSMYERDMAYHQGTIWMFPLGGYYLAWLKVHDYSEEAKCMVKEALDVMESAMREGCIGQLPEIYDGKNPSSSRGCFAQAWSVGEMLRVYEAVEK